MGYGIIGLGVLAGGPGGGGILGNADPLNWHGLWAFGGVSACVSGIIYTGLRVARNGSSMSSLD